MNLFLAVRPVIVNSWLTTIEHNIAETHLKSIQPKPVASVLTSSKYYRDSLVAPHREYIVQNTIRTHWWDHKFKYIGQPVG